MPYDNKQSGAKPGPTMSWIRLYNQSEWALLSNSRGALMNSRGALVVVGADIRSEMRGPVIDSRISYTIRFCLLVMAEAIWFNFWFHGYCPYDNHVRLMKIDGTKEPFQAYHLHGQPTHAAAVFGMNHARNVDIYGTKSEFHARFMDIIDSKNFRIYGMGCAFGPLRRNSH